MKNIITVLLIVVLFVFYYYSNNHEKFFINSFPTNSKEFQTMTTSIPQYVFTLTSTKYNSNINLANTQNFYSWSPSNNKVYCVGIMSSTSKYYLLKLNPQNTFPQNPTAYSLENVLTTSSANVYQTPWVLFYNSSTQQIYINNEGYYAGPLYAYMVNSNSVGWTTNVNLAEKFKINFI